MAKAEPQQSASATTYAVGGLRWRVTVEHHPRNTRPARWAAKVYLRMDETWYPTMGVFRPTMAEAEGEAARYLLKKAAQEAHQEDDDADHA